MAKRPPKPADRGANPRFKTRNANAAPTSIFKYFAVLQEAFKDGVPYAKPDISDTEVVISATAIIDYFMRIIIMMMFRAPISDSEVSRIFDNIGPLSTFNAKAQVARAFAITTPDIRGDVEVIRSIRNLFAHSFIPKKFADPDIAAECNKLTGKISDFTHSPNITDERKRFIEACTKIYLTYIGSSIWHYTASQFLQENAAKITSESTAAMASFAKILGGATSVQSQ